MGIVNLNNATRIDVMSDEFDHNFAFNNNTRSGILFLWSTKTQKIPTCTKNIISVDQSAVGKLLLDVAGNSAYFRDSHQPALGKLNVSINNLMSRTPSEVDNQTINKKSNALLISTPHDEHWPLIQKFPEYQYLFVDKPLLINKHEYEDYKKSDKKIIALMNRRYSAYTQSSKEFITNLTIT